MRGESRSRWKPPSFPRLLPTYLQLLFLWLPGENTCLGLELGDPEYGIPARVDILLGGKVFSKAVLHGRRFGPTGAPSALKTCFDWIVNGKVKGKGRRSSTQVCCDAPLDKHSQGRSSGLYAARRDYRVNEVVCLRKEPTACNRWPISMDHKGLSR